MNNHIKMRDSVIFHLFLIVTVRQYGQIKQIFICEHQGLPL